jgi:hypothetical protein
MLSGFENKNSIIKLINNQYDSGRLKTRKIANKFLLKCGESD